LVDIPIENEKTVVLKDAIANSKPQTPDIKDAIQASTTSASIIGLTNSNALAKATVAPHDLAAKKHGLEQQHSNEKKNKEVIKVHTNAEKNRPKTYDSDIALLSALVANTSKSSDDASNITGSTKKPVIPAINLDVVERNPGDNTKNLLARCEKLGGIEAKLCHDRICSGSWQSESACSPTKG
jgi:hypothetical protein